MLIISKYLKPLISFLFIFGVFFNTPSFSQGKIGDTTMNVYLIGVSFSYQSPQKDLDTRFGPLGTIGAGFTWKTSSNWMLGAEYNTLLGNNVKEDPLAFIKSDRGFIINANGTFEIIDYFLRGHWALVKAGRLFNVLGPNPNSGVYLLAGGGYFEHKIKYRSSTGSAPQILGDYEKGYNRLSGGPAVYGALGYLHLSNNKLVNFSLQLEVMQAFTKSYRAWDFDKFGKDNSRREDMMYGIKLIWSLPLYRESPDKYYYY